MRFILTAGWEDGVADLTERLVKELSSNQRVLWLVSGGSNAWATAQTMKLIDSEHCQNLTIAPVDERYGPEGHQDSNWTALLRAGFEVREAQVIKVLQARDSLEQTLERYRTAIADAFEQNDVIIAQLGIGPDGHTAGILPGSAAAYETQALVTSYESEPFTRLTLTFPALEKINVAYAFAYGEPKRSTLTTLQDENLPVQEQPAQILKLLSEAYLYNDQVGEI